MWPKPGIFPNPGHGEGNMQARSTQPYWQSESTPWTCLLTPVLPAPLFAAIVQPDPHYFFTGLLDLCARKEGSLHSHCRRFSTKGWAFGYLNSSAAIRMRYLILQRCWGWWVQTHRMSCQISLPERWYGYLRSHRSQLSLAGCPCANENRTHQAVDPQPEWIHSTSTQGPLPLQSGLHLCWHTRVQQHHERVGKSF